jgi:putative DNA primase/helicase
VTTAAALAARIRAKRMGKYFIARCPAHDDHDPSLSFFQGHTAIVVKCFRNCAPEDIIAAFRARGLWDEPERKRRRA